jgi:hypothetical protein
MKRPFSLCLHELNDRIVPSISMLDLTQRGAVATTSGAIVRQVDAQPTGTGHIQSFVRLQSHGVEQGYNTSRRPLQFDEKWDRNFTRDLKLSDVPVVTVNGVPYREFLLDINQRSHSPRLSLDAVRIYTSDRAGLSNYRHNTQTLGGQTARFDLDAERNVSVMLNARLNAGSGKGDMVLLVPESAFEGVAPNSFVYLYSRFGGLFGGRANGGFEEWSVRKSNGEPPPPPAPPAGTSSLSGMVFFDDLQDGIFNEGDRGLANIAIILRGIDTLGNPVERTTSTSPDGTYRFDNLRAGTYSIVAAQTVEFDDGPDFAGSLGGTYETSDSIDFIEVGDNQHGIDYLFTEIAPNS